MEQFGLSKEQIHRAYSEAIGSFLGSEEGDAMQEKWGEVLAVANYAPFVFMRLLDLNNQAISRQIAERFGQTPGVFGSGQS